MKKLILLFALSVTLVRAEPALMETLTNPVDVVFNKAYKGPYEENEKAGLADPRHSDKYLLAFLASAKKTLDVCIYDVNATGVVRALIAAKDRGVRVRIVSEYDNTFERDQPGVPAEAFVHLRSAGIPIEAQRANGLMHCKFVIADGEAVWFASMNWTHNALYRDNNNNVFVRSPEVAAVFQREFDQLFEKHEYGRGAPGTEKPIRVGDAEISIRFSPQGGAQAAMLDAIRAATNSIRFMIFSFTDRDMGGLLAKKKRDGLTVEGIFDECQVDSFSEFRWLGKQGVKVWQDGNQALLHHKVMIIDNTTVCCGSYNFSRSAEQRNNEASVIIRCPRIAAEYRAEFDRLVYAAEHNRPVPPYDHPACNHGNSREALKPVPAR